MRAIGVDIMLSHGCTSACTSPVRCSRSKPKLLRHHVVSPG